jgi:hypothetical protein
MITAHVPAVRVLLITRVAAWLRLSRREEAWKTAEILILRHQLALLQRRQPGRPKLNWPDRALLATLPSVIPKAHPPDSTAAEPAGLLRTEPHWRTAGLHALRRPSGTGSRTWL